MVTNGLIDHIQTNRFKFSKKILVVHTKLFSRRSSIESISFIVVVNLHGINWLHAFCAIQCNWQRGVCPVRFIEHIWHAHTHSLLMLHSNACIRTLAIVLYISAPSKCFRVRANLACVINSDKVFASLESYVMLSLLRILIDNIVEVML